MPEDPLAIDRDPVLNSGEPTDTTHELLVLRQAAAAKEAKLTREGIALKADWQDWIEPQTGGQAGVFGGIFSGTDNGQPYQRAIIIRQALDGKRPVLVSVLSVDISENPHTGVKIDRNSIVLGKVEEMNIVGDTGGQLYIDPDIRGDSSDPAYRSVVWAQSGTYAQIATFDVKSSKTDDLTEIPDFTGVARHEFELVKGGVGNLTAGFKLQRKTS